MVKFDLPSKSVYRRRSLPHVQLFQNPRQHSLPRDEEPAQNSAAPMPSQSLPQLAERLSAVVKGTQIGDEESNALLDELDPREQLEALIGNPADRDLLKLFGQVKQWNIDQVSDALEVYREEMQAIANSIEKITSEFHATSNQERLDNLSQEVENKIKYFNTELQTLQEMSERKFHNVDLEKNVYWQTTQCLDNLWTIALKALTQGGIDSTVKEITEVLEGLVMVSTSQNFNMLSSLSDSIKWMIDGMYVSNQHECTMENPEVTQLHQSGSECHDIPDKRSPRHEGMLGSSSALPLVFPISHRSINDASQDNKQYFIESDIIDANEGRSVTQPTLAEPCVLESTDSRSSECLECFVDPFSPLPSLENEIKTMTAMTANVEYSQAEEHDIAGYLNHITEEDQTLLQLSKLWFAPSYF
ncbi:hypothetical protein GYMLUDRAFT_247548 [Collybiopsis luxurians FD-317 M1]|uniref:Uncharacterized protein n=1 Tax=Collybiopsis luxurians FD-317 M1 TaxID=944289 RepID=A0A0D0CNC4_9AGAR|nr:hypothetical protein GYMLUDRAFT_247548 [Collybiopsis luxurians FD-317 M1]